MKSEENCRDWKTESEYRVNESLARNRYCHICGGGLIENSFVNWHPDPEFKGCHKECRDGLPEPEPKSEVSEKRYDVSDESSDRKWSDKTDERKKTIYGQYYWNDDDESRLEEMLKDGKSVEEIADELSTKLPLGSERSENAIRSRIKKLGLEEKTGVYLRRKSGSSGTYSKWTDDELSKLKEMWKDEYDLDEIADELGRTKGAIEYKIRSEKQWQMVLGV